MNNFCRPWDSSWSSAEMDLKMVYIRFLCDGLPVHSCIFENGRARLSFGFGYYLIGREYD